jgi:uncharacterized membrane protein YdjX (TVP38/TMEM64 family)
MVYRFRKLLPVFLLLLLLACAAWYASECKCVQYRLFTPFDIRNYIRSFGSFAAVAYITAYILNTISVIPPIGALSLAAGLAFGAVWGGIYLMAAAMAGTSITFFISRYAGRRFLEKALKGKLKVLDAKLERNGLLAVVFFRVIPLIPYELLNYGCGLTAITFRDYFWGTLLGLVPGVVIAAFFGGSLGEVKRFSDLLAPKFLFAAGLMALIILVPLIYHFLTNKPVKK